MRQFIKESLKELGILLAILFVYGVPLLAYGQDDISLSTGIVGGGKFLGAKTADNQTTVPSLGIDANGNTVINALAGKSVILAVGKTPSAALLGINSPVLIATPITGTNFFAPGLNIVPATVTASTAAFLGAATPTPGTSFTIYNSSASSVFVKAAGGATINGATAGGKFTLATLCRVTCEYTSATNASCAVPTCLTPSAA